MSTFGSLNAATTGLWAQRRALDVTGQNIANVNTEGYSRQRAEMEAIGGSAVPAFHSTSSGIGGGVSAEEVTRIRDVFLESRGHTEHANSARLAVESGTLEQLEVAFREPGDSGIQSLMSEMWDGWEDVANSPDTGAARAQLIQRVESLAAGLNFSAESLSAQWDQTHENLGVLVQDVNAATSTIAELNGAIQRATRFGLPANDLTDKRDLLVMTLADKIGATVRPGENGMVDVTVRGMTLVAGGTASALAVDGGTDVGEALAESPNPPRLVMAASGYEVRPGGTAEGQLATLTTSIPYFLGELNTIAAGLATTLNDAQAAGFDRAGLSGTPILESADGGPITAASIRVAFAEPEKIAASGLKPDPADPENPGNLDNGNADAIAQLRNAPDGPDAAYRALIVELGVQAAVSNRDTDIQSVITTQVDAAREAVAGVNLDEEMTNMLSYQHAYGAAGRLVTAIDEMLDVLINRTGLVGR